MSVQDGTKKKRRKALFSWRLWNEHDLLADGQTTRLDVAEFPGQKHAQEQNDRKSDPNGQGARHAAAFRAPVATILEHEIEREPEARQDADEGERDDVLHDRHYPRRAPSAQLNDLAPPSLASPPAPVRSTGRFWLVTAAAVLSFAAMVSLGQWQLSRAAQKEALQAQIDARKTLPPLDQQAFLALDTATSAMHRPLRLRGLWLAPLTVYLDNRQMHGVPGFYVVTPFAIEGSEQAVLVQRGWVQRNFNDRSQLAPVDTPAGLVEVVGRIEPPPSHLLDLGRNAAPAPVRDPADVGSSRIRQNLDLEAFRAETKLPLRTDVSLQQTGASSEGLQRDWPAPALGVEKHYGYAFQWFGLAALVVILYVWFQVIAPYRRARRARHG